MKRLYWLLIILFSFPLLSTAQTVITYNYDDAGNRTTRKSTNVVACVGELQIVETLETPELDSVRNLPKSTNFLYNSFASNDGEVRSSKLPENSYLNDRRQSVLDSTDSSINRAQMITIKQKRI